MWAILAKLLTGPLLGKITDIFVAYQKRKGTEAEFRYGVAG
jgi:hypothetical protein